MFFYLGFLLWKRERIDIIHEYHVKKVKERDKKAYTMIMGKAMTVIAIGLVVSGIIGGDDRFCQKRDPFRRCVHIGTLHDVVCSDKI